MKVKHVKINEAGEKQLITIRNKFGLISDSEAMRLAIALTARDSNES